MKNPLFHLAALSVVFVLGTPMSMAQSANSIMVKWTAEETIVQIHGVGPLIIHYADPKKDPRKM